MKLLVSERGDRIRLEIGTQPLITINGQDFPIQGPAVAEGFMAEILRVAANSREVRAFREQGTFQVLHESGESRFMIRAAGDSANSRIEIHVLRS